MRANRIASRTRRLLGKLAEHDTKGAESMGENIDDGIHEALEILALVNEGLAENGDFYVLQDLNSAFSDWLKG